MLELVAGAVLILATASTHRSAVLRTLPIAGSPALEWDGISDRGIIEAAIQPASVLRVVNCPDEALLPEYLRALTSAATCQLVQLFGADSSVVVREFVDPESEGEPPEYFLVVNTHKPPEEAGRLLDEFLDSAWLEQADPTGRLNVTVEFPV